MVKAELIEFRRCKQHPLILLLAGSRADCPDPAIIFSPTGRRNGWPEKPGRDLLRRRACGAGWSALERDDFFLKSHLAPSL
jgi:hypothetical protein